MSDSVSGGYRVSSGATAGHGIYATGGSTGPGICGVSGFTGVSTHATGHSLDVTITQSASQIWHSNLIGSYRTKPAVPAPTKSCEYCSATQHGTVRCHICGAPQ
jgi:hypothetical protein